MPTPAVAAKPIPTGDPGRVAQAELQPLRARDSRSSNRLASPCRHPATPSPPRRGVNAVSAELGPEPADLQLPVSSPSPALEPAAPAGPSQAGRDSRRRRRRTPRWRDIAGNDHQPPTAIAAPGPNHPSASDCHRPRALDPCRAIMHMRRQISSTTDADPQRVIANALAANNGRGRREIPPPSIRRTTSRERSVKAQ